MDSDMIASTIFHEIPWLRLKHLQNRFLLKAFQDIAIKFLLGGSFPSLEQYF